MTRDYQIMQGEVKYIKDHGWHNQYSSKKIHGRLSCPAVIGFMLGLVWKWFGLRVVR